MYSAVICMDIGHLSNVGHEGIHLGTTDSGSM